MGNITGIGYANNTFYVTGAGLTALKIASNDTLTKEWMHIDGSDYKVTSNVAVDNNGIIYYVSNEYTPSGLNYILRAINPNNGTVKWAKPISNNINTLPVFATTISSNGTIYVTCNYLTNSTETGKLYAFNPNGTVQWVHSTNNGIILTAAIIGADGTIYIGVGNFSNYSGNYLALNPNGSVKWTYNTGLPVTDQTLAPDGSLYVMGMVYNPANKTVPSIYHLYAIKDAPTVVKVTPSVNATGVSVTAPITVKFNENISQGTKI